MSIQTTLRRDINPQWLLNHLQIINLVIEHLILIIRLQLELFEHILNIKKTGGTSI